MTTPRLIEDLKRDEGLRLHAYPDPRTGAQPWTCGYGATGPEVGPHTVWTLAQAEAALARRVNEIEAELDRTIVWWRRLDDARQDVLVNMAYNLGVQGLLAFEAVLADAKAGRYARAADAMLRSAWAREVGVRARRLADQMRAAPLAPSLAAPPAAAHIAGPAVGPGADGGAP